MKLLEIVYIIIVFSVLLFFLLGTKELKKNKNEDVNNKKAMRYFMIFAILVFISIILSGIMFF